MDNGKRDAESWQGAEILAWCCEELLQKGVESEKIDRALAKATGGFFESYADLTNTLPGIQAVEELIESEPANAA